MPHAKNLERWQKRVLLLCWLAYASAYIVRSNISIALPGMSVNFHWNNATSGILGSAFFWAYAIGQLINGYIGDKFSSRYFIFVGLTMSALSNLVVGLSSNFAMTLIAWSLNGFFLSMLWGPIVKTVSVWYPEEKMTGVSVILSLSMIGGYLFSWGAVGQLISSISWRFAFYIPAAIVFAFAVVWVINIRSHPNDVGLQSPVSQAQNASEPQKDFPKVKMSTLILNNKLWLIAVACFVQGFVKDGLSLWAPTLLMSTQNISRADISRVSLFIPIMSMAGILCSGWLNKLFRGREKRAVAVLFSCSAAAGLLLFLLLGSGTAVTVILLGVIDACMYGANTLLLTIIPLRFSVYNKVSAIAGFLDFCSYIGAAGAGVLIGAAVDAAGWKSVAALWSVLSVIGIASLCLARAKVQKVQTVKPE